MFILLYISASVDYQRLMTVHIVYYATLASVDQGYFKIENAKSQNQKPPPAPFRFLIYNLSKETDNYNLPYDLL